MIDLEEHCFIGLHLHDWFGSQSFSCLESRLLSYINLHLEREVIDSFLKIFARLLPMGFLNAMEPTKDD